MNILAIIPARGGSKSIPKKNIRELMGKPLIAYSIEQAHASKHITRTIVSTDDPEIAAIARSCGAEVPFMRPAELAEDTTKDLPVFIHALEYLEKNENYKPDIVVHLRPTAPLRTTAMIDEGIELLIHHPEADSIRGIAIPRDNPHKMWRIGDDHYLKPLLEIPHIKEPYNEPRQALPTVWYQIAYIDIIYPQTILEKQSMTGEKIVPLYLNVEEYIDLDSLFDWHVLETYLQKNKS